MKLSAPKQITFWLALAIAVLAVLLIFNVFPSGTNSATYTALLAFVVLVLGNILKGL